MTFHTFLKSLLTVICVAPSASLLAWLCGASVAVIMAFLLLTVACVLTVCVAVIWAA